MSKLPEKRLLRRGEVIDYLGVTEQVMSQMVACETLKPVYLTGANGKRQGRAFFKRSEVLALGGEKE